MFEDTIVSISTALGNGAISIIRISGKQSIQIVNKIYKGKDLCKVDTHTIHYGHIVNPENNKILDEVMVTVLREPKTYTKEDIVEINSHGGIYVTNKVLQLVLENGARLAEPGEFTKRAFLNGRIDLAQAESVMDVINAKSEQSLRQAVMGVDGRVSRMINELRDDLLSIIANIEVNIDYPEYDDVIELTNDILLPKAKKVKKDILEILETAETGKIIREGIKTVIIGRPNVGKSSLLNKLIREEKAIVTDIAGTTRDIIEGYINIAGIVLRLIDTAGIRETEDIVEKIGVERSRKAIEKAELVLLVLNNNEELSSEDKKLLEMTKGKNRIIIINKVDLEEKLDKSLFKDYIETSMMTEYGIKELEKKIKDMFHIGKIQAEDMTYITNARHISKLKHALQSIDEAISGMNINNPVDFIEIDIKSAWVYLGEIIGKEVGESLIDELFSKFCLGK